jgi:hypothetical protein
MRSNAWRADATLVIYGGIHSALYTEEAFEPGDAHLVKGDGDIA